MARRAATMTARGLAFTSAFSSAGKLLNGASLPRLYDGGEESALCPEECQ